MQTDNDHILTDEQRAQLRSALDTLRLENERDRDEAQATLDTLSADHTMTDGSLREVAGNAEYMVEDATAILAQIDLAIARMDAGTFGLCTSCHQPIPFARLELRPYGTTCVPCSS